VAVIGSIGEHEPGGVKRAVEADPVGGLSARTVEFSESRHEPVDDVEALVLVHVALAIGDWSQSFVEAGRITREGVPPETGLRFEPDAGRVEHRFGLGPPFQRHPAIHLVPGALHERLVGELLRARDLTRSTVDLRQSRQEIVEMVEHRFAVASRPVSR